jgi:hypothetical protein
MKQAHATGQVSTLTLSSNLWMYAMPDATLTLTAASKKAGRRLEYLTGMHKRNAGVAPEVRAWEV